MFFKIQPKRGSINDVNPRLINFYRVVRDQPEKLITQARQYKYDETTYYNLRKRFNQPDLSSIEEAALLLYFNKTAYNGLYRVNSRGEFNVPVGRYKDPTIVPESRIRAISQTLKDIEIFNEDFSYIVNYAKKGELCYLDPPYQPVSETANFTSYSEKGFDVHEQRRLKDACIMLDKQGVLFVLSNSDVPPIREMYEAVDGFRVGVVLTRRTISSKASTRGLINEILVTNIPKESIRKKKF